MPDWVIRVVLAPFYVWEFIGFYTVLPVIVINKIFGTSFYNFFADHLVDAKNEPTLFERKQ